MLAQGTGKPILTSPYSRKKCAEVSKTSRSPTTRPGNPSPNIYRRFIQHAFGTKKNRNPRGLQPSEAVSGAGSFPASIGLRAHDAKREGPSTDLNVIFSRLKKVKKFLVPGCDAKLNLLPRQTQVSGWIVSLHLRIALGFWCACHWLR